MGVLNKVNNEGIQLLRCDQVGQSLFASCLLCCKLSILLLLLEEGDVGVFLKAVHFELLLHFQ